MTRRHHKTERGSATAELVVATPLLLAMLFGIVQFALWQHASHIAEAAAQEGARSARLLGGTTDAGRAETVRYLDQLGNKLLIDPQVSVQRTPTDASVEVSAHVKGAIPFVSLPVHAVSSAPLEQFSPGGES